MEDVKIRTRTGALRMSSRVDLVEEKLSSSDLHLGVDYSRLGHVGIR